MGVEVCPVHKPKIKSLQIFSIHVDDMLRDPQPKGIKRKYPEEDESDPPTAKSYSQQRQEVFEISYEKLCRFRQNPDSSLLRYVLIFNTMRKVEQEMERDGIKVNCMPGSSFLSPVNCEVSTLDPPPPNTLDGMSPSPPIGFPAIPYANDTTDSRNMQSSVIHPLAAMNDTTYSNGAANATANFNCDYDKCVMDFESSTSGRVTPFVRTPYDRVESGALWNEENDRLPSLNWSSVFSSSSSNVTNPSCFAARSTLANGHPEAPSSRSSSSGSSCSSTGCNSDNSADDSVCSSETSLHTLMPPTAGVSSCISNLSITYSSSSSTSPSTSPSSGNASPTSGSSPTSSEDEIFGDIDLTLYDFDLLSPLSPPNVRMAPVSAEELMRSLSDGTETAAAIPCATNAYYKSDHFSEEHAATSVRS